MLPWSVWRVREHLEASRRIDSLVYKKKGEFNFVVCSLVCARSSQKTVFLCRKYNRGMREQDKPFVFRVSKRQNTRHSNNICYLFCCSSNPMPSSTFTTSAAAKLTPREVTAHGGGQGSSSITFYAAYQLTKETSKPLIDETVYTSNIVFLKDNYYNNVL